MIKYISQSPLIPVVFCSLVILILLLQCFAKRRFLKTRFMLSAINLFIAVLILVFFDKLTSSDKEIYSILVYIALLGNDLCAVLLLFSTIDFSMTQEKFQKTLTKSLDQTKYFAFLDKKDKVKNISSCLLENLEIPLEEAVYKNFFDVVESKYRIVGLNGEAALKDVVKKYFNKYEKKVQEGQTTPLELDLQLDDGSLASYYFVEHPIFSRGKYVGRILLGDMKSEESLVGLDRELTEKSNELDLIRNRFTTILYKTTEGIFFNTVSENTIWFNDVLVEKLCLNGNSLDASEFYCNMHPEDIALYENTLKSIRGTDYSITYRYNTGSYYVYVKEVGQKITVNGTVEYCGIMSVVDDFKYERTNTILDSIGTEADMQNAYRSLLNEENNVFMVVYFKVTSIPEINERFGRPIGNTRLSDYVNNFKKNFVTNNYIYRVNGLEFVAFITNFNRMEVLKNALKNEEKILHISATYGNEKVSTEVSMGVSYSNDTSNRKDVLKNAKDALRIASNPQFKSSYAFYRDVK